MVVGGNFSIGAVNIYNEFISFIPPFFQGLVNIFLIVLLVVLYSVLIWKFYKFIGKKNVLSLNLGKYNHVDHPFFTRLVATGLYLLEYIIILPLLVFVWFTVFTVFLILMSSNLSTGTILFLSVTIVGSIRMLSYIPKYGQAVAQDIAKIIPYTLLAIFLTNPSFFNFSRVIQHFGELPGLFVSILSYLLFIIALESLMRFFDMIFTALGLIENQVDDKDDNN